MRRYCFHVFLVIGFSFIADERPLSAMAIKETGQFVLRDGDRVVMLGNTLVERAQKYGYWETLLTARYPRRNISFRNLGWSGDTVWAESRGLFDAPEKGYRRMLAHVGRLKPTVIFLGYGGNEAYAGRRGLPSFVKQYNRLIDDLTQVSPPGVRFVILSPIRHEQLDPPLPNPVEINRKLARMNRVLSEISKKRGFRFVDLYSPWKLPSAFTAQVPGGVPKYLTDDGMHLTAAGYFVTGVRIAQSLSLLGLSEDVRFTAQGRITQDSGVKISKINVSRGKISCQFRSSSLNRRAGRLQVDGAPKAGYALRIDGKQIVTATGQQWKVGTHLNNGPDFRQWERLRTTIIEKNRLYFYRWRPQNVTYLFLFRKHEQGQNAKEIPQFDKLVAAKETEIARLKKPVAHRYEFVPRQKK